MVDSGGRFALKQVSLAALLIVACSGGDTKDGSRDGMGGTPPARMTGTGGASSSRTGTRIPGGVTAPTAGSQGGMAQGGSGGTTVVGGDDCAAISQTADNQLQPADIIFAVDNSGSMDEEIVFVREQLNAFSQQIVDSGIDVHIILISAPLAADMPPADPGTFGGLFGGGGGNNRDNGVCVAAPLGSGTCPEDSNLPHYMHVPTEVGSRDALNLFVSTFPQWQSQLRPEATKTFVVVTDDNAEDNPNNSAAAFTQAVTALDSMLFAKWSFSGIFCFSECEQAAAIGSVYTDLVAQTSGVGGDLCLQDFAPVFDALAHAVIQGSKLDCQWEIPPAPMGETFDAGKVNVQYTASGATAPEPIFHVDSADKCDAPGGWFYDDDANATRILVCPATCDALQADSSAKIDVLFGCATMDGPD